MNKDMEMSCDEHVLRELGPDIKKDYSTSLLSLAVSRKILSSSPLAFGESNAKTRIKNVLNYKKPAFWVVIVAVIAVIGVGIGLIANPRSTAANESDFTKEIYQYRTPYLGDNSKVVHIADRLPIPETLTPGKVQLFTDKAPYTVEITYQTTSSIREYFSGVNNQTPFDANAILMFALIGNTEYVNFVLDDGENDTLIQRSRDWAKDNKDKDVWESSSTLEKFTALYKEITNKFTMHDSLGALLGSGKKINIQSVNDVPNAARYEKVEVNGEVYFIYEKSGKYYSEKPYQYINEITGETYQKIKSLMVSDNGYQVIKLELSLIPKEYSRQNAIQGGCFVIVHRKVESEQEIADKFIADTHNGKKASLKIVQYTTEGDPIITKVIYDGTEYYGVEDDSRDAYKGDSSDYREFKYQYLKTFEAAGMQHVFLLKDNTLTFEQIQKSFLSSNSNDRIDCYWLYTASK